MKKIVLILAGLFLMNGHSFANILVYSGIIGTQTYQMSSNGNTRTMQSYRMNMVMDYDETTRTFTQVKLIKYWKEKGQRFYLVSDYQGTVTVNFMTLPQGKRVFMQCFTDGESKNYEFSDSPPMQSFKPGIIGSNMSYAGAFDGAQLNEYSVPLLGQRTIYSASLKFALNPQWTRDNSTSTVDTVVMELVQYLSDHGYQNFVP